VKANTPPDAIGAGLLVIFRRAVIALRAPLPAKLIKFADIIDNARSIGEHDRQFFKVWAAEKIAILTRMLEVVSSSLSEHALFKRAWSSTRH
jgi:hypothetical protein